MADDVESDVEQGEGGEATRTEDAAAPAPPAKPDIGKRVIAVIIDAVLAAVVSFVPVVGGILATAYWLVRDGLDFDFMDHRSIGKKVMKLRPVTLDGQPLDIAASVKRNWMFGLGGIVTMVWWIPVLGWLIAIVLAPIAFVIGIVELVLVLTDAESRRMGDKMAGTRVIETDE